MRIEVKIQPNSKHESIEQISPNQLKVKTRARPIEGKANERLIELLAEYFKVPRSKIRILHGLKSKLKLIEVDLEPS